MLSANESGRYKSAPLSDDYSDGCDNEEAILMQETPSRKRSRATSVLLTAACGLALVMLYSAALVQMTMSLSRTGHLQSTRLMKSINDDFIEYEFRVFDQFERPDHHATYFTTPNPEVDRNWHSILGNQNIRIPRDAMQEIDRVDEGIELPGGGFFGSIMVFHHLHCLKNLYHALHPEYYNLTKMTSHEKDKFDEHNDHCLHMLREAVICQADTTLLTMKWNSTGLRPIGNLTSPHECVNWGRLMEWVVPKTFDALADGVLVHPTFGMDPGVFHPLTQAIEYASVLK
ncbi:Tat pathway signal sequence [Colletotrichum higginsianum IMI 349063]|uniref:Tat pathway signal sequence n=1 Tax=Colletotrichum higginsianum (strain IMI 349063) TaxID=759273 RepID=A0A1B7XU72_COLHI|nr:Tat pathway signal sequence [Colletotrichum higginsianum IMI 349063]OBR03319.1 Tat pathway signal sequence [Colletotrichum higginsianum IMI 349063]